MPRRQRGRLHSAASGLLDPPKPLYWICRGRRLPGWIPPRRQSIGPKLGRSPETATCLVIAVGTPITGRPRTEPYVQLSCIRVPPRMFDGWPRPSVRAPAPWTRFPGTVSGTCGIGSRSPWPPPLAPPPPLPVARPCSAASLLLWRSLTSHARASSASVSHLPDAGQSALQPVVRHETSQVPTRSFRA